MSRLFLIVASLALFGAACAPAAPSPTAPSPAPKPAASPAEKPAASPAAKPSPKAEAKPPAEWEQVLEAAKRERTVAVKGPIGDDRREILTQPFQKQYGISVEYIGMNIRDAIPKVTAERAAGQYLWDVFMGGTGPGMSGFVEAALDPLEPALILPDVKDPRTWRGGAPEFWDTGRRLLVMTPSQRATIFYNPNLVKPDEIKSYKDLLDPKWKGKIIADDPRSAGPGNATFTFLLMHPDLGPGFIRALAQQDVVFTRDSNQYLDAVGQGGYPILLGGSDSLAEARMKLGVPIAILDPRNLKEGSDVSPSVGAVGIFNRAPHPNAARVYINWLLSKEGQTDFVRTAGYISSRLDVPTDHSPWRVPIPGSIKSYTQEALGEKDKLEALLVEVFGR